MDWLQHPHTRDIDLDDPLNTEIRREILNEKGFLRRVYQSWYGDILASLSSLPGRTLELGTGAGFLREYLPQLIRSDILPITGIDVVLEGGCLPFADRSLANIIMVNVLHHIPDPRDFFREAQRCLQAGGVIAMLEPWISPWSNLIYKRLHYEGHDPCVEDWEFPSSGPLSSANNALPWVIFERDRDRFTAEFPGLAIGLIDERTPFTYLLSGGISTRISAPAFLYPFFSWAERSLLKLGVNSGMFALVVLHRR
jgi:SAM-dependent methyltransferase